MLKIAEYKKSIRWRWKKHKKRKVDLKELEKFGFKKCKYYLGNVNYYGRDRV